MQKIVVSAIIAIMVTVSTYLFALALGASEPVAAVAAVFAAATATAAATFALATTAAATFALATTAATTTVATATVAALATAAAALAVAAFAAFGAQQEGIKFRWAIAAYAFEAVAIWAALTVAGIGWSIAIALSGVVALLVLWRFASKSIATPDAPSASTVPESNGA